MAGPSDAVRAVGSIARLVLRLVVLGGFVYWFLYASTAFNNGRLEKKAFGDVDSRYGVAYKPGGSLGAVRIPGDINLAIIISWSVLIGGAFLTTISEWLPSKSKATRLRRLGVRVVYVLNYQLWPRRLWSGLLGGLSVRDALLVALFCYCVVYAAVNNYLGRLGYLPSRLTGVRSKNEGAMRLAMFAHSVGEGSMLPIWLLFLTVPKGSFIQTLLGIDYHGMIRYHRWVGNMLFVVLTLHGWLYYLAWWIYGSWKSEFTTWNGRDVNQLAGSIAWLCFAFLFVTSSAWIRRRFYELFYRTHLLFMAGFVIFGTLHSQLTFSFFLPGLLLLSVDLVFRSASFGAITEPVSARVARDGSVAEVALLASASRVDKPMHRVYLTMDRHSRWQWHPFSVSGRSPDGHLYLAVKRYGAWTSHLLDALARGERLGLRAHVPRDHSAASWENEDAVLLVAGGIGVTAALSVLDELVLGWQERRIHELGRTRSGRSRRIHELERTRSGRSRRVGGGRGGAAAAAAGDERALQAPGDETCAAVGLGPGPDALATASAPGKLSAGEVSRAPPAADGLPRKVVFVWVARHPCEFGVLRPNVLEAASDPSGWLDLRLHCTARGGAPSAAPRAAPAPAPGGEVALTSVGAGAGAGRSAAVAVSNPTYAPSSASDCDLARPSVEARAICKGRRRSDEDGDSEADFPDAPVDLIPGVPGSLAHGGGLPGIRHNASAYELSAEDFGDLQARQERGAVDGVSPEDSDDSLRKASAPPKGLASAASEPASTSASASALALASASASASASALALASASASASASALTAPAERPLPSACPLGSFTSPFFWSRPRRLRLEQHSDVLFLLVHVLAALGAYATMGLMGTYIGRLTTREALVNQTPAADSAWRQSALYLLGLVTGGLGLPFFAVFIYETVAYWLDVRRGGRPLRVWRRRGAERLEASVPTLPGAGALSDAQADSNLVQPYSEDAPGVGSAGAKEASEAAAVAAAKGAAAAARDASRRPVARVSEVDVVLRGTDVACDILSGRPVVADLMAEVQEAAGPGGVAGVYVAGSRPLNDALHVACGEFNHSNKGVLFVHHKITGEL